MIYRGNYLLAREFLSYLREVMLLNAASVDRYWSYLKHLLVWADAAPFHQAAAIRPTFTTYMLSLAREDRAAKPMAALTVNKILQVAKRLFTWAKATYPQNFRKVPTGWVDALRLPHDTPPVCEHEFVTLEEVLQLVRVLVAQDDLATWRDQAAAAMLFLSGARATAFSSLTLECVDLASRSLKQWTALGVKTKNGKSATTYLLEIPDLLEVVEKWDGYVRSQLPPTAAWYAPIGHRWGEQFISTDTPGHNRGEALLKRLRKLFEQADVPYKSPHAFRHGHAVFALQHCRTMADYKAVSMNLMHGNIVVTDGIYAPLANADVKQRVVSLTSQSAAPRAVEPGEEFADALSDQQLAAALKVAAQRLAQ